MRCVHSRSKRLKIESSLLTPQNDHGEPAAIALRKRHRTSPVLGTCPFLRPPLRHRRADESEHVPHGGNQERSPVAVEDPGQDGEHGLHGDDDEPRAPHQVDLRDAVRDPRFLVEPVDGHPQGVPRLVGFVGGAPWGSGRRRGAMVRIAEQAS